MPLFRTRWSRRALAIALPNLRSTGFTIALIVASLGLMVPSANGQFVQYTAPGSLGEPQMLTQEDFEKAVADARWRMGPLRLNPWYSIRSLGYTNNVFGTPNNPKSDFTATVGAGLKGYVPIGDGLNLAFHALPEYVWWYDLADRRTLNGRYGGGLFGYFDAVTLQADVARDDQQQYISSEVLQQVNVLRRRGHVTLEVELLERFSIFGSGTTEKWQYDDTQMSGSLGERVLLLDRREDVARGGLRYRFDSGITLGVGMEYSNVDFLREQGNRSNEGKAPLAELQLLRTRVRVAILAAFRSLDPKEGSLFERYEGVTGRFFLRWMPGSRLEYQLFGSSNLAYTIYEESSYFEDQRIGAALVVPIGWRISARGFGEWGKNRYTMFDPSTTPRLDDVTSYGGSVDIELGGELGFSLGVSQISYDSNYADVSRSFFRLTMSITMKSGDSPWL